MADLFSKLRTQSVSEFFSSAELDLDIRDKFGRTLVQEAIACKRLDAARLLIERSDGLLNSQDKNGQTALHFAATYGVETLVEMLLRRGADPNIVDKYGNGPLWTSALAAKGNYGIVKTLVAAGADARHKNQAGRSVLDVARQTKRRELWDACTGGDDFEQ